MTKAKPQKKKRNQTDITLRNLRAMKKQLADLKKRFCYLHTIILEQDKNIAALDASLILMNDRLDELGQRVEEINPTMTTKRGRR